MPKLSTKNLLSGDFYMIDARDTPTLIPRMWDMNIYIQGMTD